MSGDVSGAATADDPAALVAEAWSQALADPKAARAMSERALAATGDPHTRAGALRNFGYIDVLEGDVEAGFRHCEESLAIFSALGDAAGEATVHEILTRLHLELDAVEVALEHGLRTKELALQVGDPVPIAWALHNLGEVHKKLGDGEVALGWYDDAIPYFEQAGHRLGIARTLHLRSKIEAETGNRELAREHLVEAMRIFQTHELPIGEAHLRVALADIAVTDLLFDEALDLVGDAEALAPELPLIQAHLALTRAEALTAKADAEQGLVEARTAVEIALQRTKRHHVFEFQQRALAALATVEEKAGNLEAVADALRAQVRLASAHARSVEKSRVKNLEVGMAIAATRREAEVTERLLRDVLPASVVRELRLHGRSEPTEVQAATVLFTDLVGFTQIAAKVTPVRLVSELDTLFGAFDAVMARFGLEKVKTIGDAYMAVGGAPEPHAAHAIAATLAALHCREVVRDAARAEGALGWSIRIGLHTGPLVAGIIGKARLAYDVWGDTVNLASRMESSGEPLRVNVSAATYQEVKAYFICEPRGRIKAKGKGEVEMFFVERLRPEHSADDRGLEPNDALWGELGVNRSA